MISRLNKIIFIACFLFVFSFSDAFAMANGIDVNLQVGANCNHNNVCEAGEDMYSCPADCVPTKEDNDKTGGMILNYFDNLTIEVGYNKAIIRWESNVPTVSVLKWGTNPDYKDGVVKNVNYLMNHRVEINDLKDGTIYYFNIESANYFGVSKTLENQKFQTLFLPDTTPPGNPTNVKISSGPYGITVSWKNPTDLDFDYVRIMRTEDRYYGSPLLGNLVYEGRGEYFTDTNVIEGHKYFYVLFARDKVGNYSSGSLASIIHNPKGLDNIGQELPPSDWEGEIPSGVSFLVIQNSSSYNFTPGDTFKINGDEPVVIKTNYFSKIKNDDLWVEIRDSDGVIIGQYFFERVRDKDNFIKVSISSFPKKDHYHIFIYKYTNGISQFVNHGWFDVSKTSSLGGRVFSYWYIFLIIIIFIFVLLLFIFIMRKIIKKIKERRTSPCPLLSKEREKKGGVD